MREQYSPWLGLRIVADRTIKKRNTAFRGYDFIQVHPKVYRRLCRTKKLDYWLRRVTRVYVMPAKSLDFINLDFSNLPWRRVLHDT